MLWPLTLPTDVLVNRPVLPVMPLRSTTSQAKNVRATTTISGLAALRKACIVEPTLPTWRGDQRALSLSRSTPNLKAAQWLAVDRPGVARYSHGTHRNDSRSLIPHGTSDLGSRTPDGT